MAKRDFFETRMFSYHRRMNIAKGILAIFLGAVFAALVVMFVVFRNSDIAIVVLVNNVVGHITAHISSSSILGILYTSLIGGLFFIFLPMEVLFAKFMGSGYPMITIFVVYLGGLTVSYTLNYFIGSNLANLSKKIITPRKFYAVKGKINQYGGATIFIFNALPFPSQILAVILGVFKYNKTRFYVYFLLGQIVKCSAIALGVYYIL